MKKLAAVLLGIVVLIFAAIWVVGMFYDNPEKMQEPIACTMEAMICPDGSSVGRTGPKCEFAECPGTMSTTTASGVTFSYIKSLPTTYITAIDWPPQAEVQSGPFICEEAGSATDRAGETKKVVVGARTYCVTQEAEGAAGSTYIQYAFTSLVNTKVVTLTFTTREVQCMNYDNPEQKACLDERNTFDITKIVDGIFERMSVQ